MILILKINSMFSGPIEASNIKVSLAALNLHGAEAVSFLHCETAGKVIWFNLIHRSRHAADSVECEVFTTKVRCVVIVERYSPSLLCLLICR